MILYSNIAYLVTNSVNKISSSVLDYLSISITTLKFNLNKIFKQISATIAPYEFDIQSTPIKRAKLKDKLWLVRHLLLVIIINMWLIYNL